MKSTNSVSLGFSRAADKDLDPSRHFLGWFLSSRCLSKKTYVLLAVQLQYDIEYLQHRGRRIAQHFDNKTHLFMFLISSKQRVSQMEFSYDTSKTPHINFSIVWNTQYNLRGSIISALNVCVYCLLLKTTGPKVNNFYA